MLIESSRDLLNVVLAFCVLWLTVFLSWLLYYVIAITRDAEAVLRQVKHVIEKLDELAHVAHDKMERSAASLTLIGQALKEIVVWAIDQRGSAKAKGKK